MRELNKFYIDGAWVDPSGSDRADVINPANESVAGHVALGNQADVDKAVAAARRAFESYSRTSREERIALLEAIAEEYKKRMGDIGAAITEEMGAPAWLANTGQAGSGLGHIMSALNALKEYQFEHPRGTTLVVKEPIGVVGMITPWNWPMNQVVCKVAPALAVGCTVVLKPSEVAPFSAQIFAEVIHAAGVPKGVFNLVHGDGPTVGAAISSHPGVDMVSITGSTRAGIEVAKNAAPTVKRVVQELGGKSPNVLLDGINFEEAVTGGIKGMMLNCGQSCAAPSRMLVPASRLDEVKAIAKRVGEELTVGDPNGNFTVGPVVSEAQFNKIQGLLQSGVDEGATALVGGPGRPEGLEKGYYVKPTIFADVTNDMRIAREEIFGPVLCILSFKDEEDAIRIANDTDYGLAGMVSAPTLDKAKAVASRIRAGYVNLNGAPMDFGSPFGGYKQSGNGREWGGHWGFDDYLEIKSLVGALPAAAE